ncbi:hypothetical protein BGZ57DRAFT_936173 [Hyaloscypha finlandica]|nr:hypothetical protein BGZ57DRAFT_936173 [Hyaloscypha finlandica]
MEIFTASGHPMEISAERAIDYERLIKGQKWMTDLPSLKKMHLLGIILQDQRDTTKALELAETLLPTCEKILGSDHDLTIEVGTWSTTLRLLVMEINQNQQRVLAASIGPKQEASYQNLTQTSSPTPADHLALPEYADLAVTDEEYSLRERVRGFVGEYGEDDQETLEALDDLAAFCARSRKLTEASSLFKVVWQRRAKLSGASLPTTLVLRPFYDYLRYSKEIGSLGPSWMEEYPAILIYAIKRHY